MSAAPRARGAVLVLAAACASLACADDSAEQKAALQAARAKKAQAEDAERRAAGERDARTREFARARKALADSLKSVAAKVASTPAPAAMRPCTDERFADLGFEDRRIDLFDQAHLAELQGAAPPAKRSFTADDAKFLTDGLTDEVHGAGGLSREVDAMARRPFVGVIRQGDVMLPWVAEGKLVPGKGRGWLVIHERASGEPLCEAPYAAESSATVAVEREANKRDLTDDQQAQLEQSGAVIKDFREQHRAAYIDALKKISTRLVLATSGTPP